MVILWMGFSHVTLASEEEMALQKVRNNLKDPASLQRGATLYMNYCLGCHSLQYSRYVQMGEYIGMTAIDEEGQLKALEQLIQQNLNFVSDNVTDSIVSAIPRKEAEQWFGIAPPDLSLVTRARGKDWVYTYLKSFYKDESRPWGVNNLLFKDVAMPHALLSLQGTAVPIYQTVSTADSDPAAQKPSISHLEISKPGTLTEAEYDKAIKDLVNFLEYMGEPVKLKRQTLGVYVLLFLIVLTAFLYLLKREYWKDIH
jgi:ubiquinol-cytochrome c reductase cytochrome c1 subunit